MYLSKRFAALPPRQKLLARFALYGGLAVFFGLLAWGISYLNRPLKKSRDDLADIDALAETREVKLLQEYIRIDTSPTTGSELDGALFLAKHLEEAGLEPHIERLGEGKANLWAVLEGESKEAIVLHNHIDVFSVVEPEEWDFPPFEAVINQAWLYGRGVFDMKSIAIAQLEAIADLASQDRRPQKSIVFLASGSEEVGSDLGTKWILANQPALRERLSFVLTEGGVVEAVSHDEIKFWGTEFAQKWFAYGWACHQSRERLEQLRIDLETISGSNHELRMTPEVREFLVAYAGSRGSEETRQALEDLQAAVSHPDRFASLPPYLKSLFRDETATFDIEPDPEGGFRLRIILHLLPGSDFEHVKQTLLPSWVTTGVSLVMNPPVGAGFGSPIDHPTFEILVEALQEAHPQATVGPYFLVWSATDARFFRQANIPAYGFSPFLIFATDSFRRDTFNERMDLRGYVEGVDLYKRIVRRLAS